MIIKLTVEEYEIIELAIFMHQTYEDKARLHGWVTQEKTRVPFEKLPEANAKTMLAVAKEVISRQREGSSEGTLSATETIEKLLKEIK